MRNRSKSLIAILFISVFLLSVITNSEDSNLQYKVKNEDASLKSSDNGITINTPENIVYNEPMSGFYHGTFGFENELHYTAGLNLEFLDEYYGHGAGVYCDILSLDGPSDGHNKILNMRDAQGGTNTWGVHHIDNPQSFGTIEFFLASNQPTSGSAIKRHYIQFRALDNTIAFQMMIQLHDSTLRYYDGSSWQDIITTTSDVWYHHSINFNCEAGTNGQFSWIVSSEQGSELARIEDIEFENDLDTIEEIYLGTVISDYSGTSRWDAFGFSWDANYEIGDNRNETILLGYEPDYDLDWQGYSLDGQENVTIIGNTTLPMLSNGLHSVQVFGNDSIGNNYQSNLIYFTVSFNNNAEPELTNGNVSPRIGDQTTEFNFTITYWDEDNSLPSYVNVVLNDTTYAMEKTFPSDNNYTDGCYYEYTTFLMPSEYNYSYYFECSDGKFTNTTTVYNNLKINKGNYNNPQLLFPEVSPDYGGLTTDFIFNIWYYDLDDNYPLDVNITIDTSTFSMIQVNSADTNATDGIEFSYNTNLDYEIHNFRFNCSDGLYSNSTSWIIGPEVNPLYGIDPLELLTPSTYSQISSNLINFSWSSLDAGFGAVNFTLQVSNVTDFSHLIFQSEDIAETPIVTNFSVPLSITHGDYYWRVKPRFGDYNGSWSSIAKFTYTINENIPLLVLDDITPTDGTSSTIFRFTVIYSDLDNNAPEYVEILINGIPYSMEMVDPLDGDFTDGCIYQYLTLLTPSTTAYTISFECFDGAFQYLTSSYQGPLVESDSTPSNNQGDNNFNSTNIFVFTMMLGIPIGIIIPFIAFAEIKVRKMKLGEKTSAKIKKKKIKS